MARHRAGWPWLAGILGSALLCGLCAHGGAGWTLAPVVLVPWLVSLERVRGPWSALAGGAAMAVAFVLAVLGWFGIAIGRFSGWGDAAGVLVLVLAAPLLQPQLLAFALVRWWAGRRWRWPLRALAGACAWVACEWLWPKLLGDTLGHGVVPSPWLRQLAEVGGAAGITFVLLLVNEAIAAAILRRGLGARGWGPPLAGACAVLLAWAGYGAWRVGQLQVPPAGAEPLRVGIVQSNITDYERLRRERGAYEVVREVLDVHFALSARAVGEGADALLWSETVYPTPFGFPRSEAGAEFDAEITARVDALGVPLVFGSYDLDAQGEYNAAVVLEPGGGVIGRYRKTRPFPLSEHVPAWLDGPVLRRLLPWAGTWQPGDGARVLPLRLRDGREVPVQPLICLDDVNPRIAIDGARLGAQLLLGLSNDSWFSADGSGARLHLAVARLRSVETRLPQLRATADGISTAIDPAGDLVATTVIGEQALLVAEVLPREPTPTLAMRWGDWVGAVALGILLLLAALAWLPRLRLPAGSVAEPVDGSWRVLPLTRPWRAIAIVLQVLVAVGLVWVAWRLFGEGARLNALPLLRQFAAWVAVPAVLAALLDAIHGGRLRVAGGRLLIAQRWRTLEVPVASIAALRPWRLPLPRPGVGMALASGAGLPVGMGGIDPATLARATGQPDLPTDAGPLAAWTHARVRVRRWWIDHVLVKYAIFALVPALPAFRLHQHIAYGSTFGEWLTFGPKAWLLALLIWWASWVAGLALFGALLRVLVEAVAMLAAAANPSRAIAARRMLEACARALYFVGVPAWLLLRLLGG